MRTRSRRRRGVSGALGVLGTVAACSLPASAFESTLEAVPCAPMPEKAYRLLRQGIESFRPNPRFRALEEKNKAEALAVLERWRLAPWPDLTGLRRVRVVLAERPQSEIRPTEINAWKISDTLVLLDDFTVRLVGRDTVTPLDYEDELREMVDYATASVGIKTTEEWQALRRRKWRFMRGMKAKGSPLYPWYVRVHHAYAAALLGHEEAVTPLMRAAMHTQGGLKLNVYDMLARDRMGTAMLAFSGGSSREELLAALEETHTLYPDSECDREVVSLIKPLRRELAQGPPDWARKRPEDRSGEEEIRALVHEFRDLAAFSMTGSHADVFGLFGFIPRRNPCTRLVEFGQKAVPQLIEALDDYTPTRSVLTRRRVRLLRRMDVAMEVIEAIAGCDFHAVGYLHEDTPERRDSAVANVKKWWAMSEGKSQAEGIRIQLSLWDGNETLRVYERINTICDLALLEGPEAALAEAVRLPERYERPWGEEERSPRADALKRIDPRPEIRETFERFWKKEGKSGDLHHLVRHGDGRVYAELARRFEATGRLDPTGDDLLRFRVREVARYGSDWAVPILAQLLGNTGTKWKRRGTGPLCSAADVALEEIQGITGRDFGYREDDDEEKRLAAVAKAREWWQAEGREASPAALAGDGPARKYPGDLFMSDEEIDTCIAAIRGEDAALRRETVAGLGRAFHHKVQRALMAALDHEAEPSEKVALLRALRTPPRPWHLPPVVRVLESDADVTARVEAARFVRLLRESDVSGNLEGLTPCVKATKAVRRVALDPASPVELRRAAAEILMTRSSHSDFEVLRRLAADPAFRGFGKLHERVRGMEKALERQRAYEEKRRPHP